MSLSLFDSTTIPILQEVVNFNQARHTVLAANIANMDTPGYKVRDLSVEDFQARLRAAVKEQHAAPLVDSRSPGETYSAKTSPIGEVAKNSKTILHHDQSNVGMEQQVSEMAKNQLQHNMAIALLTKQFRMLETAISERV